MRMRLSTVFHDIFSIDTYYFETNVQPTLKIWVVTAVLPNEQKSYLFLKLL